MKKQIFIFIISLFIASQAFSQDWVVPESFKTMSNPQAYNLENVKKGKDLYMDHCKSCHGDPGKHNGLPLVPPPPDITSEAMQNNTEGELFYKITNGRGPMPRFEATISEDDRWRVISYIMNFNPDREPVLVSAPPRKAKILASVNEPMKKVEVFAEAENNGKFEKLIHTPVTISAEKYFGNIKIGEVVTDENGRAEFKVPESLIGDEEGYVNLVIHLDENFVADNVVISHAKVAKQKEVPKLIRKGEIIWSTNENIQIWLLLSYLAATGAAWLAIGYVIFQIIKIRKLGKE